MTPPTAATSSTIDVISKASRWSVRNSRPIQRRRAEVGADVGARATSRPPAFSPITTMISTKSAPAASTAPSVFQLGPPAHGVSCRGPTYAITNRNITITAPA